MSQQLLLEFIVSNNHPFSIVEEEKLKEFLASLNPHFKLPSRTTVKNRVMALFAVGKEVVKETLNDESNGKPSASTDLWTAGNQHAMLGVTVSWLDNSFNMHECVLGFRKMKGDHGGSNIAAAFSAVLGDFGIDNKVESKSIFMLLTCSFLTNQINLNLIKRCSALQRTTHLPTANSSTNLLTLVRT